MAVSIVTPIVSTAIYYSFFNSLKSFNLAYIFNILFLILVSFGICFYLSKSNSMFSFSINFFSSLVLILIVTFMLTIYHNAITIKSFEEIKKEELYSLALLPVSYLLYGIIEIFMLIFGKEK